MKVKVTLSHYGSLGGGVVKVAPSACSFAERLGWTHTGDGTSYAYYRKTKRKSIMIELPSEESIRNTPLQTEFGVTCGEFQHDGIDWGVRRNDSDHSLRCFPAPRCSSLYGLPNWEYGQWDHIKEEAPVTQSTSAPEGLELVDYSERAIAIIGDTKPIKDQLKALGGKFNPRLKCGVGWIFSKRREVAIRAKLGL